MASGDNHYISCLPAPQQAGGGGTIAGRLGDTRPNGLGYDRSMPRSDHSHRRLFDVSPRLSSETPVWPGDQALIVNWTQHVSSGHFSNLSAITLTPHLGAHVDAPLHLFDGQPDVGAMDLRSFIGPATVVDLRGTREVTASKLAGIQLAEVERLLLRTRSESGGFSHDFPHLTPEAAELLARSGLLLLGIDTPSVDAAHDDGLPVHRRLLEAGVAILEGLELDEIEPGLYELIALPLRLSGVEASPVRAVLRPLEG